MAKKMDFQKNVLQDGQAVVVDFWAPWCGYCRRLGPVVDRMEQEFSGKLKIVKLNIDEEPEITEQYNVDTIPTLMLFQNGKASEPLVNPSSWLVITDWLKANGVE